MWLALVGGAGFVAVAAFVVWRYGRSKYEAGQADAKREQVESARDAQKRMDDVDPKGESGTVEELEDGGY